LYLIDPYDQIKDSEIETGFADDEYALVHTIYSFKQDNIKVPSEIDNWLLDRLGKMDKIIGIDSQKNIEARLSFMKNVLNNIADGTTKSVATNRLSY